MVMKLVSFTALSLFAALLVGGPMGRHNPSGLDRVTPEEVRDALGGRPGSLGGLEEGWIGGELPKEFWPQVIQELEPIKVYSHRVNRVIALDRDEGAETGYYVYIAISSYYPTDDEEWTFTPLADNIWSYTRILVERDDSTGE